LGPRALPSRVGTLLDCRRLLTLTKCVLLHAPVTLVTLRERRLSACRVCLHAVPTPGSARSGLVLWPCLHKHPQPCCFEQFDENSDRASIGSRPAQTAPLTPCASSKAQSMQTPCSESLGVARRHRFAYWPCGHPAPPHTPCTQAQALQLGQGWTGGAARQRAPRRQAHARAQVRRVACAAGPGPACAAGVA